MKPPVVSGNEAVKAFQRAGYEFDEQHGSHMILRNIISPHRRRSVPNRKERAKGTLRALTGGINDFGISPVSAEESHTVAVYLCAVTEPRPSGSGRRTRRINSLQDGF